MVLEINLENWLADGAIISIAPGRVLLGWGKRQQFASGQSNSFYFPDFFLKDHYPWFHFEHTQEFEIDSLIRELAIEKNASRAFTKKYTWKNDYYNLFSRTFTDIKQQMAAGQLKKAVPFVFESSPITMSTAQLAHSLYGSLKYIQQYPAHLYGLWDQTKGIVGITPEILFCYNEGQQLQTMACAGTCGKETNSHAFLSDPKQINEHLCVVEGIKETLLPFGNVNIGERQLLSLPNINHIVTPISVDWNGAFDFDKVVKALHPTPALGAFPRQIGMRWLEGYQQHIDRRRFGAPVGVFKEDGTAVCYVAIRNVQWDSEEMLVGAGCGIVPASQCANEWAEINLKLKATKEMLGLL